MTTLPNKDNSVDAQLIQILGPDGIKDNFQYDAETNTYYSRRGTIIIPTSHGFTHVSDDPVPAATVYRDGLMSKDDKAKLDALVQTRIGVVGFTGAGFPDDGGFLDGTILFGSSDGIVIEKVGNLIRWTMNAPVPITCNVEECAKIYWIQDETQSDKIRPPICAGKMFGATVPGELDVVIYPDNLIVNSNNPIPVLGSRSSFPGFKVKRYVNSFATQNLASLDVILERANDTTTKVGWSMTPGPLGVAENVWFMGTDADGGLIRFEMNPAPLVNGSLPDSSLLGSIVYNGHTLTRQMAIITNYTSGTTSLNEYECKFWSVNNETAVGDPFVAVNVWRYNTDNALVKDRTEDILLIGTLVEIWEFQVQELNGNRIVRRYFNKPPRLNPAHLFSLAGSIRFGHILGAREEVSPGAGETDLTAFVEQSEDLRLIERDQWGITGFEDPVLVSDDLDETSSADTVLNVSEVLGENAALPSPNVEVKVSSTLVVNDYDGYYAEFTNLSELAGRTFFVYQNSTDSITISGIDSSELNTAVSIAGGLPTVVTLFSKIAISAPSGIPVNNRFLAHIDSSRPALVVENADPDSDRELPVFLWHRSSHKNFYLRAKVGMPISSQFPPIDILLRAPVDSFDDVFMQVISRGHYSSGPFSGRPYIKVAGVSFKDLPKSGTLRVMTGIYRDTIWKYDYKIAFGSSVNGSGLILVGQVGSDFKFDEDFVPGDSYVDPTGVDVVTGTEPTSVDPVPNKTTILQLLRHDYSSPCLRIESSVNNNTGSESVQMQFKVGMLDMSQPYELNLTNSKDNYVRGLRPGEFTVSRIYTQDGFIEQGTETVSSNPSGFVVYNGNSLANPVNGMTELFNDLEVIYKDDQLWVFWNGLLVTPDPVSSAALAEPVAVNTAYFPLTSNMEIGKVALRLWPGAVVREVEVRDQLVKKNEYMYGQLEILTETTGTGTGTGTA